jgi:hypothetical protein
MNLCITSPASKLDSELILAASRKTEHCALGKVPLHLSLGNHLQKNFCYNFNVCFTIILGVSIFTHLYTCCYCERKKNKECHASFMASE